MKTAYKFALLFLTTAALFGQQRTFKYDDTLAKITPGKSTVRDFMRLYGEKLTQGIGPQELVARWDGQCEISASFSVPEGSKDTNDGVIGDVTLKNLSKNVPLQSPCKDFASSHGLKLGDSPLRVRQIYGRSSDMPPLRSDRTLANYTNAYICRNRAVHSMITYFSVQWYTQSQRMDLIGINYGPPDCDGWRDGP